MKRRKNKATPLIENIKIVVVMLAGRSEYMRLSASFILSEPVVDRFDIWFNPSAPEDAAFLEELATTFPNKIRLIKVDKSDHKYEYSKFYEEHATDEGTLYVKVDDDIVWLERGAIAKIAKFQIDNPQYFLTTPCVINNMKCFLTMLERGVARLSLEKPMHNLTDQNGLGLSSHKAFIAKLEKDALAGMDFAPSSEKGHLSINMIAFLGKDFKAALATHGWQKDLLDEDLLSMTLPQKMGKDYCIYPVYVAHLSFSAQLGSINRAGILQAYARVCETMNCFDRDIYEKISNLANKHRKPPLPIASIRKQNRRMIRWNRKEIFKNIKFIFISRYKTQMEARNPDEALAFLRYYTHFHQVNEAAGCSYTNKNEGKTKSFFYRLRNEGSLLWKNLWLYCLARFKRSSRQPMDYPYKIEIEFGKKTPPNA